MRRQLPTLVGVSLPLSPLPAIAFVLGVGALAQWLAWRFGIPAILFLLTAGFAAGPLTGLLDPDALFGNVFRPFVSLAVIICVGKHCEKKADPKGLRSLVAAAAEEADEATALTLRENLRKARLQRLDPDWAARWLA